MEWGLSVMCFPSGVGIERLHVHGPPWFRILLRIWPSCGSMSLGRHRGQARSHRVAHRGPTRLWLPPANAQRLGLACGGPLGRRQGRPLVWVVVLASWVAADVRRCWTCSMSSSPVDIPTVLICFPRVQQKEVWLAQGVVSVSVGSHPGVCQCMSHPCSQRMKSVGMRGSSPLQPLVTS